MQLFNLPRVSALQYYIVVKLVPERERSQSGPREVRNWAEDQSVKRAAERVTEEKCRSNAENQTRLHRALG